MKKLRLVAEIAMFITIVALVVIVVSSYRRSSVLESQRRDLCHYEEIRLESLVQVAPDEMRGQIVHHFLDQGLSQMCLGKAIPLDAEAARACWIQTGRDDCFKDIAVQLLQMYRQRAPNA